MSKQSSTRLLKHYQFHLKCFCCCNCKHKLFLLGIQKLEEFSWIITLWCKRWSLKPFSCSCQKIAPILHITLPPTNPHISILGNDTSSIFDHVLHSNLNNVAIPNVWSFPKEFMKSFHSFFDQTCYFAQAFFEPIPHVPPQNNIEI